MKQRYDVAVIGAGVVGVSTALHLLMRGKKVILIDRRDAGQETSHGNAGVIQTYDTLPFGVPPLTRIPRILLNCDTAARVRYRDLPRVLPWILNFYWQSRPSARKRNGRLMRPLNASALDEHRALMRGTDAEKHLALTGRISLHRNRKAFDAFAWELDVARDMGVPFEVLDAQGMKAIEPHLKPVYHRAVRWLSSARLTNPAAVMQAYAERFVREGGVFMQAEVTKLAPGEIWTVVTSGGNVEAKEIIICAGPWAHDLLKPLAYRFPFGIKRGYHRHYAMIGGAQFAHAFTDVDIGYVMAPMEQGFRLVTGVEFAAIHAPPDPAQLDLIMPYARQLFPLGEALEEKAWCGNRPCFADSRPVIDRAPRHPGLWFNIGHGHSGMTIGPGSGRLLAEMMTGEKPFCDPAPYSATRFSC